MAFVAGHGSGRAAGWCADVTGEQVGALFGADGSWSGWQVRP